MRAKIIYALAVTGILAGLAAAFLFGRARSAQPPVFAPVASPYATAIYANGIIESDQGSGSNVNVYPEVSGAVIRVLVHEGQIVAAGTALATIDASVQQAITAQAKAQADAGRALLEELRAQPRREVLTVARSQVALAEANLKVARDQYDKRRASFETDPHSISKDVLDTAQNTEAQAQAALQIARDQLKLTESGSWTFEIENQRLQVEALTRAYEAGRSMMDKYTIRARENGVVLAVNATVGTSVTPLGAYDSYTQGQIPLLVLGAPQDYLAVRCFVDEILVSRLPPGAQIRAQMSLRGSDVKIPLEFVRVQPYVSPKIELSNQRQERVDLRVLPVIFRFRKPDAVVFPGQLVDVYIGRK